MENRKIKVVWICSFSDEKLRKNLKMPKWYWGNIVRNILGMRHDIDNAVWNTNARNLMEKHPEIELHIIMPHSGVSKLTRFTQNGISYYVFWEELEIIKEKINRNINRLSVKSFPRSRKLITSLVDEIRPDVIHVIGAENFYFSLSVLDIPRSIPIIVQLQTLISEERFEKNYGASEKQYQTVAQVEQSIINRADYIGTTAALFRERISSALKPNVKYVDTTLPLTEPVFKDDCAKVFDFIYFAANISKAADLAIEAFAIAKRSNPNITLDIVGGYSDEYKQQLDNRIAELGISDAITFEGQLPSHTDVLQQIRKSRFAVLPLKIDIVSGTIREAMANGLPVVSTITPGTPKLNEKGESILLSRVGDHEAMADNMLRLVNDSECASILRENGWKIASERMSNEKIVNDWIEAYYQITGK